MRGPATRADRRRHPATAQGRPAPARERCHVTLAGCPPRCRPCGSPARGSAAPPFTTSSRVEVIESIVNGTHVAESICRDLAPAGRFSLACAPKLSGAPAPNRASRATIALPESDRPDGREPAMPLPRLQQRRRAPAPPECGGGTLPRLLRALRNSALSRPPPSRTNRAVSGARTAEAIVPAIERDDRYPERRPPGATNVAASRCRRGSRVALTPTGMKAIMRAADGGRTTLSILAAPLVRPLAFVRRGLKC